MTVLLIQCILKSPQLAMERRWIAPVLWLVRLSKMLPIAVRTTYHMLMLNISVYLAMVVSV